jgi:hypothetical protein
MAVLKIAAAILAPAAFWIGLAGLCHGLFNYLTFSHTLRFLSALLILVIWAWGIRILEKQDGRVGKPSHPGG